VNESKRSDAAAMLLIAAAALTGVLVTHATQWGHRLADLAGRPTVVALAAVAVCALACAGVARVVVVRRALGRRVRVHLLPADSFDPPDEAVIRFASSLSRARRPLRGLLDAPASAARIRLDTDDAGRLRYSVELPARARALLRTAAGAFGEVELHDDPDAAPPGAARSGATEDGIAVARTELVLARASAEPLRAAGLDPDPLAGFARALDGLWTERETAAVCIDLLPIAAPRRRRLRRRLLRRARSGDRDRHPLDLLGNGRRGRAEPAELVDRRAQGRALTAKLGSPEPLFAIQVLMRATSPAAGRAKARVDGLLAAFDVFTGENHLRAAGLPLPGIGFLGSDVLWRRGGFDRRFASGRFRPRRRRLVTATEIAGLLKPPTAKCSAANVVRSGGVIPPPPPGLPSFDGQPDLVPLGRIRTEGGERTVGAPLADTFFAYMAGRSRYGKTETAIGQFLHLARSGHGCFFLDPHHDAIEKIKPYLTDEGVRERVIEIDLADPDHDGHQLGWNLFAVHGQPAQLARGRVDAVVDSFAAALGWDERNTRALNLTTQAAQALVELAAHLPAELAPTLFQIATLLGDDDWRAAVLPHVSPPTRQFFVNRFPRLAAEAITPVTNLIDRLRVSPSVVALLGSPVSTYDIRAAMDRGSIVLACPGSGSVRDRLVASFLVYDLLHAAKTRAALPPDRRRPIYAFFDEVQTYDGPNLPALLEQAAKYGVRAFLFNQNPERLSAATLSAVTTNRSHLLSSAVNDKAAALLTREWGSAVAPAVVSGLRRYSYLASVTLAGEVSPPFLVHGVPVGDLPPDDCHPDQLPDLAAAIDASTARTPIRDTLHALDTHDQRILDHLRQHQQDPRASRARRRSPSSAHGEQRLGDDLTPTRPER
jgi:hypothetical protein